MPEPEPGLVIRYAYLWRSEADAGREEGRKDRPCAIVLATKREGDATTVVVAPITHSEPRDEQAAIEIPIGTKQRLGLDGARSWIVTNELKYFTWPGPDVRPIASGEGRNFSYGYLPAKLTDAVLERVRGFIRARRAKPVKRD